MCGHGYLHKQWLPSHVDGLFTFAVMFASRFGLIALFVYAAAAAWKPHLPLNGGLTSREIQSVNATDYPALKIELPIDHFNISDNRTYSNRYWINTEHYKAGGPVFYFDSGEQNAHPLVPYFLYQAAGPSSVMMLARRCVMRSPT